MALGDSRRFSPLDYATIVTAIASILTGTFFLIYDQSNIRPLRDLKPIAKVGQFEKAPQRKVVGTLAWNGVEKEEVLFRGDQILTDATARIDVLFLDDTFLKVPPNSLIKLDFNNGNFDIELIKGYLDINLTPGNEKVTVRRGNKKYEIKGKEGKIQVVSGSESLQFKSLSGKIKIDGQDPSSLKANPDALYRITKPLSQSVYNPLSDKQIRLDLKPANLKGSGKMPPPDVVISRYPNLRNSQKVTTTSQNLKSGLDLKIPRPGLYYLGIKEPGATEYTVTPFEVAGFSAPRLLDQSNDKTISLTQGEKVALGWTGRKDLTYQIEVQAGDQKKFFDVTDSKKLLPIFKSSQLKYRVRVNSPEAPWSSWGQKNIKVSPGLLVDRTKTPDIYVKKGPDDLVPLVLTSSPLDKSNFLFEVSKDKDFKNVVVREKTKSNGFLAKGLAPGTYFWRSSTLTRPSKSTGVHKVVVKSPAVTKLPYFKANQSSSDKKPLVRFIWDEAIPGSEYEILVKDANNKVISQKRIKGNKTKVKLPSLGKYTWLVRPLDNKRYLLPSKEYDLEVRLPNILERPEIAPKQVIYYRFINGVEAYEIELPKYDFAEFYTLEVYRDKKGSRLLFKKSFPNNVGYWVSNRSGKYYYRVRITDKWGRKSGYSKMGTLIFPISPLIKDKLKKEKAKKIR